MPSPLLQPLPANDPTVILLTDQERERETTHERRERDIRERKKKGASERESSLTRQAECRRRERRATEMSSGGSYRELGESLEDGRPHI